MRLPVLFSTLPVLGVAWAVSSSAQCTGNPNNNDRVLNYFGHLVPVVNDTIVHKLGGPDIGADPGVVLAIIPEAQYTSWATYWIRDASLVYHIWLNKLIVSGGKTGHVRALVDDAVHALIRTQHVSNLAGNVLTGGLAEAVYDRNIGKLLDPLSRSGSPVADSAPLRASVLLKYANWLTEPKQNNGTWAADVLWPAIDLDLQWITQNWNQSTWDIWRPPVWGGSYWTSSMQYRALIEGAQFSRKIGRGEDADLFESLASLTFWNEKEGFMSDTTVTDVKTGGRSGIGAASLSASVFNFDPTLGCDSTTFQPCSERALAGLEYLVRIYREHFPINQKIPKGQPVLLGIFPEDQVLDGGPLYYPTFNSAEQLLDALITWDRIGKLEVTKRSQRFFQQFDKNVGIGTYNRRHRKYQALTQAIRSWAENAILLVSKHTPDDYVLTWTMNRTTGEPFGPRGVVHSLLSALTVNDAYNGLIPPSWAHGSYDIGQTPNLNAPTTQEGNINGDTCGAADQYHMGF
ncbi:glycoside hydrolase family 15 protein [Lactarius tabidus]